MSVKRSDRDSRIEEAWDLLEEGEIEAAVDAALSLVEEDGADPEARYLAGAALFDAGRLEEAEPQLRRALKIDPEDLDARSTLAELLYERCRFEEAQREAGVLRRADPEDPFGHHLASLLAERRGDLAMADKEEDAAHRLAPDSYPLWPRFTRSEFDAAVESAIAELPELFREKMGNLAIIVEDLPSNDVLRTIEDPSPSLLGLFVGTPLTEKHAGHLPGPPDAVYLFKRNLERACQSRDQLLEEIRVTLLHEVGHFMGLEEDALADSGYE